MYRKMYKKDIYNMTMCFDSIQICASICSSIAGNSNFSGIQDYKLSSTMSHFLQNNLVQQGVLLSSCFFLFIEILQIIAQEEC